MCSAEHTAKLCALVFAELMFPPEACSEGASASGGDPHSADKDSKRVKSSRFEVQPVPSYAEGDFRADAKPM